MLTKSIKLTIKDVGEMNYKDFKKLILDLQTKCCRATNKVIQLAYMHEKEKEEYKSTHGTSMDEKALYGMSYRNYIYHSVKDVLDTLNSLNISQLVGSVYSKFKSDYKEIKRYERSLTSFRKDMPIYIANQSLTIEKNDEEYQIIISLLNSKHDTTRFRCTIDKIDDSKKAILDRLISGEYKKGFATLMVGSKGKIYINISYSFEGKQLDLDKNKVLGVDLGKVNVVAMSIYNANKNEYVRLSWKERIILGGQIEEFRKGVEARKRKIQISSKYIGSKGHGYKTRMKALKKLSTKISNFRNTVNHKYSRYIVDMAVKHGCGTIQMEDLTGINKDNLFLKDWTYYDLQKKIEYKASEYGIEVKYINPKYTSQRCSRCGYIDKDNRETQEKFICKNCGYIENADINASQNIAVLGIEEIIKSNK